VPNPFLDRTQDETVIDAVLYFESQQDAALIYWERERWERDKHMRRKG
jgi:hypothetical protein